MWGLASQQGTALWNLRNAYDVYGNQQEGVTGYTPPPAPFRHQGVYTDYATGLNASPFDGLDGNYNSSTGDSLDDPIDEEGRTHLFDGVRANGKALADTALDIGDFLAAFNPIFNAGILATGQKASGRCASIWDKVWAGLSLIPDNAIAGIISKVTRQKGSVKGLISRGRPQKSRAMADGGLFNADEIGTLVPPTRHADLRARMGKVPFDGAVAHHELPWVLKDWFAERGLNVNDPQFGRWVDPKNHAAWSHDYEMKWINFINAKPNATKAEVLNALNTLRALGKYR